MLPSLALSQLGRRSAHTSRDVTAATSGPLPLLLLALSALCTATASGQPASPGSSPGTESGHSEAEHAEEPKNADAPVPPNEEAAKPLSSIPTVAVVRANLETSYVAYPLAITGLPPLIFECSLAPHFFVNQESWPFAIVLTPKVVLRMFNEESTPVRSPSFMPRISVFAWLQQEVRGKPTVYGSVTLSHHSNGQAGSFLRDDGSINHEDGSFSTNYFEFAMYVTGFTGSFLGWSSLSLQWHPGFNQDAELRDRYGLLRMHLASTLVADLPLHGQLNLRIGAILDRFQRASKNALTRSLERFPVSLSYSMTLPGIDLGVYLGYFIGHDYYNIFFDNLVHAFQIGISGGFAPTLLKSEAGD